MTTCFIIKSFCVLEFGGVAVTSTPADNSFFKAHAVLKLETGLYHHIDSQFRYACYIKTIFLEIQYFGKWVSNYGRLTVFHLAYTATKIPFMCSPEKELRGLSQSSFHIYVSVNNLFIPRIGPHIFLQQNRQTDPGNV